jgi:outer membrane lipoprotein carrier protein
MKKILMMLLLAMALLPLAAISTQELYTKLSTAHAKISTYQANVSQSNYYPQLKKTISYSGTMYFSSGKMLMSFTKPSVQRMLIEGEAVQLYDAQSNTLFIGEIMPQFGRMNPLEILQLYWDRSTVSITSQKGDIVNVSLKPTRDPMLRSLSAAVNAKTGLLNSVSYQDSGGNSVTYSFSGIKLNGSIPASVWKYTYPKNVQIIQQ